MSVLSAGLSTSKAWVRLIRVGTVKKFLAWLERLIRQLWRWLWRQIWNMSGFYGIGLGRAAPYVFGFMLGAWPHQVFQISINNESKVKNTAGEPNPVADSLRRGWDEAKSGETRPLSELWEDAHG